LHQAGFIFYYSYHYMCLFVNGSLDKEILNFPFYYHYLHHFYGQYVMIIFARSNFRHYHKNNTYTQ